MVSARTRGARAARAAAAASALCLALAAASCGGIRAPDLFLVERSGAGAGARLTLLVNEEGGVRCNGGVQLKLNDAALIQARTIQEGLRDPSSRHLSLPAGREPVLSYYVRDESGSVSFRDDSPRQPKVLRELQAFVLTTAQRVCHLRE